jgi:hypothetical protein
MPGPASRISGQGAFASQMDILASQVYVFQVYRCRSCAIPLAEPHQLPTILGRILGELVHNLA